MSLIAGKIVEFQTRDSELSLGLILGVSGKGVRLLLTSGKETNVAERNIVHVTQNPRIKLGDLDYCRQCLQTIDHLREMKASNFSLSEIHALLSDEIKLYTLLDISGFAVSPGDEDAEAALLRLLTCDTVYFRRRKEGFIPVTVEELKSSMERLERQKAEESEESEMVEAVKKALSTRPPVIHGKLEPCLDCFSKVSVYGKEACVPARVFSILEKSKLGMDRKLFDFLVHVGVFDQDESLLLRRYKVPTSFDQSLMEAISGDMQAIRPTSLRKDLTSLRTWAIDAEDTRDRDDAVSFERSADGGFKIWVHIADPAEIIEIGSPLDIEARKRATTIYMPDRVLPMLPSWISENHCSLDEGQVRNALTVCASFNALGEPESHEICESLVRVDHALSYAEADIDGELESGFEISKVMENFRCKAGALKSFRQKELKITVVDSSVRIERINSGTPAQKMVSEFMVWGNHLSGLWCRTRDIPCVYRLQAGSESGIEESDTFDPVKLFRSFKLFKKSVIATVPGVHGLLAVNPYSQITSPLRRYLDLIIHRQIKAALRGLKLPYDRAELESALTETGESSRIAQEIMDDRQWYFMLKYLKSRQSEGKDCLEAVVVELGYSDAVCYLEDLCTFKSCRKPSFDIKIGLRVEIRIRYVDLYEKILRFEIIRILEN